MPCRCAAARYPAYAAVLAMPKYALGSTGYWSPCRAHAVGLCEY